jgi:acyl-CoA reductase-like NAD-dependent aldehyde dehydrogenase
MDQGPSWIERENPARPSDLAGRVREDDPASVAKAGGLAAAGQFGWAAVSLEDRIASFERAVEATQDRDGELARLLASEMGKLLPDCLGEIRFARALALDMCRRAHRLLPDGERGSGPGRRIVRRRPFGVVAAIVPWNAPIILAMTKIAPALLSGNAVVVKPSPLAPLALTSFIHDLAAHLPDHILQVVNGGAAVGEALVSAPGIGKVAFTGGTAVGGAVLQQASSHFLPCLMELGGNDPLILLDDFELTDEALEAIIWASFLNAGQVCMAAKRLLVPALMISRFTDAYVGVARRLFRLGDPMTAGVTMGPLINEAARARIDGLATDSTSRGARVVDLVAQGDRLPEQGYFLPPRVVSGLDAGAPLVAEEQFGPIVPVVSYEGEEEMLRLANSGELGLSASVWTSDADRGWALLPRIRAGLGLVNAHNRSGFSFDLPFGGIGASGFGREYGDEGLLEYSLPQALHQPVARAGGGAAYPAGQG